MFTLFKAGLTLGLGLIISLGPQNMFLIRQGLKCNYAYCTAFLCFLCDALLILASSTSLSHIITQFPRIKTVMLVFGIIFLGAYGVRALYTSIKNLRAKIDVNLKSPYKTLSLLGIFLTTLSFSLLNPQAIIDSLVLIGGIANQFPTSIRYQFVFGVLVASFIWFYSIALLATTCSHYFNNPKIWHTLELLSGCVMIYFAIKLL